MNDQKHTPGPWVAQHYSRSIDPDDWCVGVEGGAIDAVASCSERDAALIAAAPELLAALEAAREFIIDGMAMGFVGMPEDETVLEVIEAAISKAKGTNRSEIPNSSK